MDESKAIKADIVIIGAGITGLAAAASAIRSGLKVCCIDKHLPTEPYTQSQLETAWVSALARPATALLEKLGLWNELSPFACAYQNMVVKIGGESEIKISHRDAMAENLGFILNNFRLKKSLWDYCQQSKDQWIICEDSPASWDYKHERLVTQKGQVIEAQLCIGAEGVNSWARDAAGIGVNKDQAINDIAWVGILVHKNPHQWAARQHFFEDGVLGILPTINYHQSVYVWSTEAHLDQHVSQAKIAEQIVARVQKALPFYGACHTQDLPRQHQIVSQSALKYHAKKIVLIGDAANAVHPLAGQGLNMGLRHVAELTGKLVKVQRQHRRLSSPYVLDQYEANCRGFDALSRETYAAMRRYFCVKNTSYLQTLLAVGLYTVDKVKPIKDRLIRHALHANNQAMDWI